jgi:hypothetical protein
MADLDAIWASFREKLDSVSLEGEERQILCARLVEALDAVLKSTVEVPARPLTPVRANLRVEHTPAQKAVAKEAAGRAGDREKRLWALEVIIASKLRQRGGSIASHFVKFDVSGDGLLSPAEFAYSIGTLGLSVPESEVQALCSRYDVEGSGAIDYLEFARALERIDPSFTDVEQAEAVLIRASPARPGSEQRPMTSMAHLPKPTNPERVATLRQVASSKLLRRYGSVSSVWRAVHRAGSGGQRGVSAASLHRLLDQ